MENTTFEKLKDLVLIWANERKLLELENYKGQFLKFIEETGELASAILKNNSEKEKDSFGDVLVTLIILACQRGYNLTHCLELAYNEIANRKGKTENGVFYKEKNL